MYNDIQIAQIIKTGLNNLIQSANQDSGSMISDVTTLGGSDALSVRLVNGQKFIINVSEVKS